MCIPIIHNQSHLNGVGIAFVKHGLDLLRPVLSGAGIPIKTKVESMNRTVRACTYINIGSQGALLDLGEATCPELPVESKLLVIIQLAGETVKLPGIVRHRKGNVLGIFLPIEGDPNFEEERKVFSIILQTLERGIQRRTTR